MEKIKAVIIGFAHMHVNEIVQYLYEHPAYELVGGADLQPAVPEAVNARYTRSWNAQFVHEQYDLPLFDDYKAMLDQTQPDVAFIMTENRLKAEVVAEVAGRGIDCSIEKPMAMNAADAEEILKIQKETGVEVFVNWPIAWRGFLHEMKAALDSGLIGDLIKVYAPAGHTGPLGAGAKHRGVGDEAQAMTDEQRRQTWWYRSAEGGGIYLDMLCYGAMYDCMYNQQPARSVAAISGNLNTQFADIMDNVTALYRHPGCLTVADATWTTPTAAMQPGPTLYGTEGVITCRRLADGSVRVEACDIYGEPLTLPEFAFPQTMKNIAWHYADHKLNGAPLHEMILPERNAEVMKLIEAAKTACETGKQVLIHE